jgi:hypothetical protein
MSEGPEGRPHLNSFDGVKEVVDLLEILTQRPRFGERPEGYRGRWPGRHRGIPMVCLVRGQENADLLPALELYLRNALPTSIPHALYRFEENNEDTIKLVGAALFTIARTLSSGANTRYGPFPFPRFHLVYWLMKQKLTGADTESDTELLRRLRERDLLSRRARSKLDESVEDAAGAAVPWWVTLALRLAPSFVFRAKLRGFAPGGAEYRWLLHQPYLAPHDPGTFLGFAVRLTSVIPTAGVKSPQEDRNQLIRLLVNAFLEDVRRAYRRSFWRLRAARRTAYPVILLDSITRHNGGYPLLKIINDVRNDTGAFDPLVVISGSEKVPPDAQIPNERSTPNRLRPAVDAVHAYRAWSQKFGSDTRARRQTAWYMPLSIPSPHDDGYSDVPALDCMEVRRAPIWSRAWVLALVVFVVLACGGAAGYVRVSGYLADQQQEQVDHCDLNMADPNAPTLSKIGTNCVGVTAGPIPLYGTANSDKLARFDKAQNRIIEQNRMTLDEHRDTPSRPYATIVYVSAMATSESALTTNTERLIGIATRQRRLLDQHGPGDPLVRILLSNAGDAMQHGDIVAGTLKKMMAEDPSIVGVVGMALSRTDTTKTITALGRAGLPTVAATLSADDVYTASRMYAQVSPTNDREARIMTGYVRNKYPKVDRAIIVKSNDTRDLYSSNLGDDVVKYFTAAGLRAETQAYTPVGPRNVEDNADDIGRELCDVDPHRTIAVFTGRPEDFDKLLTGIGDGCRSTPIPILAGDDISRYVADDRLRKSHPQVPFDYASFALGAQGCAERTDLNVTMENLFPEECQADRNPALDGHAALAYDALAVFDKAMTNLGDIPISSGAIWHEISRIAGPQGSYSGQSGRIDFATGQVPAEKFLAILGVTNGNAPAVRDSCGELAGREDASWCPHS